MKKILLIIGITLGILTGCSEKEKDTEYNEQYVIDEIESTAKENENYEDFNEDDINDKAEIGYYRFNKSVLIGFGFEMILKPDGTIIARGRNNNGELGNGTLLDSEEWIEIDITNVKQIAYSGNEEECTIYALKDDGSVWWWGSEQIFPKKIEGLDTVDELIYKDRLAGYNDVYAHMEDKTTVHLGNDGTVLNYWLLEGIAVDDFAPTDIVNNKYERTLYILDGLLYYVDDRNDRTPVQIEGINNAEKVYGYKYDGFHILNSDGELFKYDVELESLGGKGAEEYYAVVEENYIFKMVLFYTGTVQTLGDNKYGEVGNGTTESYKTQWWTIADLPEIIYAFSPLNDKVYAIDVENNLWAWGLGYSNLPKLQYNLDEVNAE